MNSDRAGLVDTNILILRASLDHTRLPDVVSISAVSLAELSAGPHHTDDPMERARRLEVLQRVESEFDALPFDANAARAFGVVSAAVLTAGRTTRRRLADLMIASVAMGNRLPLYTTNPRDFLGLEGLLAIRPVPVVTGPLSTAR
ncbi:type II toxin-antitoxin system VapC family toxin [Actinophytocola gossypii]|uniref:Type II toxin-antitoxin system VapC family toxin n=1 Tax=Actinophytocola gossypii TaxID=2812003 RepID=A0ABT2JCM2_9PSEU|nr:type II toxin-antitoxin system VapC family toxin [Actinophytocola gossypii]MCT2585614.1 type II toxin-antitoxin system VapC family toxin [Actinophytocola gossypii]